MAPSLTPRPGSREQFRALFDTELAYVLRVLRRLGVREADVEDVAQETFVAVHAKLDQYDETRPVRPWLFSFAFRVACNHRRLARHRREQLGSDTPAEDPTRPIDDALSDRDLVLRALESVPMERRGVLILHDIDGFSAQDIAASLELPTNTVYSRLRTARGELGVAVRRLTGRAGAR